MKRQRTKQVDPELSEEEKTKLLDRTDERALKVRFAMTLNLGGAF